MFDMLEESHEQPRLWVLTFYGHLEGRPVIIHLVGDLVDYPLSLLLVG